MLDYSTTYWYLAVSMLSGNVGMHILAGYLACEIRKRKRELSNTVPLPRTRRLSKPLILKATYVNTSTGFVTINKMASGATRTISGIDFLQSSAFVSARSMRV